MTDQSCTWCGKPFAPRTTGGKRQRFCSEECRNEFHRACRFWAAEQVWRGVLAVSSLKHALSQRIRSSEPHSGPNPTGSAGQSTPQILGTPSTLPYDPVNA